MSLHVITARPAIILKIYTAYQRRREYVRTRRAYSRDFSRNVYGVWGCFAIFDSISRVGGGCRIGGGLDALAVKQSLETTLIRPNSLCQFLACSHPCHTVLSVCYFSEQL